MNDHRSNGGNAAGAEGGDSETMAAFGRLLTEAQPRMFAFTLSLVADLDLANDLLQDTNHDLWKDASEYDFDRDFTAWACGVIRYRVLSHYRDLRREKTMFSTDLINQIADEMQQESVMSHRHRAAFNACMQKLTDRQRILIEMRYQPNMSVTEMSRELGRTASSVSVTLTRIRRKLIDCSKRLLVTEGAYE